MEKTYKNQVHLKYAISERKENTLSCLHSKFDVGKKKKPSHNDTIIAAAFPKKTRKFSHTSPFHPHPKQHRIFSAYLCAASWSIKTI